MYSCKRIILAVLLSLMSGTYLHCEAQPDKVFPDGVNHDFGKVQYGTRPYHGLRIVNTSDVPMRVVSVSVSSGAVIARSSKNVLQPNEEATIDWWRKMPCCTRGLILASISSERCATADILRKMNELRHRLQPTKPPSHL